MAERVGEEATDVAASMAAAAAAAVVFEVAAALYNTL